MDGQPSWERELRETQVPGTGVVQGLGQQADVEICSVGAKPKIDEYDGSTVMEGDVQGATSERPWGSRNVSGVTDASTWSNPKGLWLASSMSDGKVKSGIHGYICCEKGALNELLRHTG